MEKMVSMYEVMVLMPFNMGEKALSEELGKIRELIKSLEGKVVFEDIIGEQRLAYKIKKHDRGFYAVFYCELTPSATVELSKTCRLEKNILRYLIIGIPSSYELKKCEIKLPPRRVRRKEEEKEKTVPEKAPIQEVKIEATPVPKVVEKPMKESPKEKLKEEPKTEPIEKVVEKKAEKPKEKPSEKPTEKPSLASIEKKLQSIIDNPDLDL